MRKKIEMETILIVDDEPANIKALANALGGNYKILAATSGEQAMNVAFAKADCLDLILMDILMPGISGLDVTARLHSCPETSEIPVIFITAKTDVEEEAQGLGMGAVDYIRKPFHPVIVKARVRTQLELKKHKDHLDEMVTLRTEELVQTREDIVMRLAKAAETRDNETGMHLIRLSHLCSLLGKVLGMSPSQCQTLATASLMHDIGKIGIPDDVLLKPGPHTSEEREIMQTHTTLGGEVLANGDNELMTMAYDIAMSHHERWDGTGYPNGLVAEEIPLEGRITSVCDVFDALTTIRPYKKAWTVEDAVDFLKENRGIMFEPRLVDLFVENLDEVENILLEFKDVAEEEMELSPA